MFYLALGLPCFIFMYSPIFISYVPDCLVPMLEPCSTIPSSLRRFVFVYRAKELYCMHGVSSQPMNVLVFIILFMTAAFTSMIPIGTHVLGRDK